MKLRPLCSLAVIFVGMTFLTGCTSAEPAPRPTPDAVKPTTEPAPAPEPSIEPDRTVRITIGSDDLIVDSADSVSRFPYDGTPTAAIAALTEAFGHEPSSKYSGEETCWYQMTTLDYGDVQIDFKLQDPDTTDMWFVSAKTNDGDDAIVVESPSGSVIGGSYAALISANPDAIKQESEYEGVKYQMALDEQSVDHPVDPANTYEGENYDANGTVVSATDDVITNIIARWSVYGDC